MKKILFTLFIAHALLSIESNAKTPIEYTLNPSGVAIEMTSDNFVIENYGNDFVIGNLMVMIGCDKNEEFPLMSFIFDDMSSKNRSSNLLKKESTPIKYVFDDGTTLLATGYIQKGYGGLSPVCISCCISNLRKPAETAEITKTRNSRNISVLTTKKIKQVQVGDYILNIRSSAASDPLFNSVEIFNGMFNDLKRRHPNCTNLK